MKVIKQYVVKGFVFNSCYIANHGSVQCSSERTILNDLRRYVEWTAREYDGKKFSARILDRQSLDKFLAFTNGQNWLDNEWDIVSQDYDGCEDIFFKFTVEITFPETKREARKIQQFTF